jgi:hypothetical protein
MLEPANVSREFAAEDEAQPLTASAGERSRADWHIECDTDLLSDRRSCSFREWPRASELIIIGGRRTDTTPLLLSWVASPGPVLKGRCTAQRQLEGPPHPGIGGCRSRLSIGDLAVPRRGAWLDTSPN